MGGKRMPQARRGNAVIDDGVIGRMKDGIADAAHDRRRDQHNVARGRPDQQPREHEAGQPEPQHGPRADPVDDESRRGLPDAGHHVERGDQQPQAGKIQAELVAQRDIERGQDQLKKVRGSMRYPDQQDDFPVAPADGGVHGQGIRSGVHC
ncbi:hypothetical protein D9M68_684510 [compost metagenome]